MSASSNRSIFSRRINGVRRGPSMAARLAPYGSMDVYRSINLTEQLNARNEVARSSQLYPGSTRLILEQHFHDHSAVELNTGGGMSGSGSGSGSGVGAPTGIDLNVLPTGSGVQGRQYCQCEHPILQETGILEIIDTSAAAAAAADTGVGVRPTNATSPLRNTRLIQGVLSSGSGNQSFHSPNVAATSTHSTVDSGWTLGETYNSQINVHSPQPSYIQLSNNINSQPAAGSSSSSSSTVTVAATADQNLVMAYSTVHMVEQIYSHAQPAETSIAAPSNQDRFVVGPMMIQHSRSAGANSVDPRFINLQPHFQPGVPNPNLQGDAMVEDASDDENDELEAMQLDLEDLEYEDLLFLEEHMGNVNIGLAEEVIMDRLVRRYYRIPIRRSPEATELCCICLVEFKNRDVLGRIDCIHKYHFDCIKKWLMMKNCCPICQRTAILLPDN